MSLPPACNGCGFPLLLKNLYVDDGCPCNTPRGVNFTPQPCEACRTDNCVKPGHRLVALYGPYGATGAPDPALSKGVRLSLSSEKEGIPEGAMADEQVERIGAEATDEFMALHKAWVDQSADYRGAKLALIRKLAAVSLLPHREGEPNV